MENFGFFPITSTGYSKPVEKQNNVKITDSIKLYYGRQSGVGWRFVVQQQGFSIVGRVYATKDELLADLPRYASTWGF